MRRRFSHITLTESMSWWSTSKTQANPVHQVNDITAGSNLDLYPTTNSSILVGQANMSWAASAQIISDILTEDHFRHTNRKRMAAGMETSITRRKYGTSCKMLLGGSIKRLGVWWIYGCASLATLCRVTSRELFPCLNWSSTCHCSRIV